MPNTKDDWKTVAVIHEDKRNTERGQRWFAVFGGYEIPVLSFVPSWVTVPEHDGEQLAYFVDWKVLTDEQKDKMIRGISQRFGLPESEVRTEIEVSLPFAVPVLVEDVTVSSSDRGLFFSMLPEFDMVSPLDDYPGVEFYEDGDSWDDLDYDDY